MSGYDAVVVGAGPNGLSAAIELASHGLSVLVREAAPVPGGAARTAELIRPGYFNDICSSVHPLGMASPFFQRLPLRELGVQWVEPGALLAHPFDDGHVAVMERSLAATGLTLGDDGDAWRRLFEPFLSRPDAAFADIFAPLHWPEHPLLLARFGLKGLRSAWGLARSVFRQDYARGLFAGIAAHSGCRLEARPTAAFGLVLAIAGHGWSWPFVRGGSQAIVDALVAHLQALGGTVECDAPVADLRELPPARIVLLDVTPRQLLGIAGSALSGRYRRALEHYRYGPATYKVDWVLNAPIPWKDARLARAGTIHLGGRLDQVAASERAHWRGERSERPFTIVAQPSAFDPTRAPAGGHVAWGYCHVPLGSDWDMTSTIEAQIERFAPGFRDTIDARHSLSPRALERHDANLVGGDIAGGTVTLRQLFFRPALRANPYRTPLHGVYLCSSSTPPGGGVHGMCGYYAARTALRDLAV